MKISSTGGDATKALGGRTNPGANLSAGRWSRGKDVVPAGHFTDSPFYLPILEIGLRSMRETR